MQLLCWSTRRRRGLDESKSLNTIDDIYEHRIQEKPTRLKVGSMLSRLTMSNIKTRSLRYSHTSEVTKQESKSAVANSMDVRILIIHYHSKQYLISFIRFTL
jgi:hypothetical protein